MDIFQRVYQRKKWKFELYLHFRELFPALKDQFFNLFHCECGAKIQKNENYRQVLWNCKAEKEDFLLSED